MDDFDAKAFCRKFSGTFKFQEKNTAGPLFKSFKQSLI